MVAYVLAAMARQALTRQALQTATAVALASVVLLAFAPAAALVRVAVGLADELELPVSEVTMLSIMSVACLLSIEMHVQAMISGRRCVQLTGRQSATYYAAWVLVVVVAKAIGVEGLGISSTFIAGALYVISGLVRPAMRPCRSRGSCRRRSLRMVRVSFARLSSICTGLTVILYVYQTVFTRLEPVYEVLAMGLGMPMLQMVCMAYMARIMGRQERYVVKHMARIEASKAAASASQSEVEPESEDAVPVAAPPTAPPTAPSVAPSTAKRASNKSQIQLMMVLAAEIMYSTGAFSTLALAESEQTFVLSLLAMSAIEVVQVALHVKARRVVARVASESTATVLLCNDERLLQWLMHQELGEKTGVVLSVGVVAIDKAFGRDAAPVHALSTEQLARRGLLMVLLELVGDLIKDLVSQAMGLAAAAEAGSGRVPLAPLGVGCAITTGLAGSILSVLGLALGSESAS